MLYKKISPLGLRLDLQPRSWKQIDLSGDSVTNRAR